MNIISVFLICFFTFYLSSVYCSQKVHHVGKILICDDYKLGIIKIPGTNIKDVIFKSIPYLEGIMSAFPSVTHYNVENEVVLGTDYKLGDWIPIFAANPSLENLYKLSPEAANIASDSIFTPKMSIGYDRKHYIISSVVPKCAIEENNLWELEINYCLPIVYKNNTMSTCFKIDDLTYFATKGNNVMKIKFDDLIPFSGGYWYYSTRNALFPSYGIKHLQSDIIKISNEMSAVSFSGLTLSDKLNNQTCIVYQCGSNISLMVSYHNGSKINIPTTNLSFNILTVPNDMSVVYIYNKSTNKYIPFTGRRIHLTVLDIKRSISIIEDQYNDLTLNSRNTKNELETIFNAMKKIKNNSVWLLYAIIEYDIWIYILCVLALIPIIYVLKLLKTYLDYATCCCD